MADSLDREPRAVPPSSVVEETLQDPEAVLEDVDSRIVSEEQLQQHDLADAVDHIQHFNAAIHEEDVVAIVSPHSDENHMENSM